ncbi:thermonuclease family protein [Zavarzinia sp. CC-PAN008]|uniref:thermonuclease family protein n=1 Tax=Zavarzinia sp. CC-PAN008 TaxID=3243332 RepID=UPI003F747CDF
MHRSAALALAIGLVLALTAMDLPDLPPASGREGRVAAVVDGATLALAEGPVLVLAGIQAPLLPEGRTPWPHAQRARDALAALVLGRVVRWQDAQAPDRHGRVAAQVRLDDGRWLQAVLVAEGQARVRCRGRTDAAAAQLLPLEATARAARRGLWALDAYDVQQAHATGWPLDRFQIVEGTVARASRSGARLFLDFGPDWRQDFSVVVSADVRRDLERSGIDPAALTGRTLRVRGWAAWWFGPQVALTCAAHLEVLAGPTSPQP